MTGAELLYLIGDIDDLLVERAEKQKHLVIHRWVKPILATAVAACLIFAVITSVTQLFPRHENPSGDIAPMIYVNSTLYIGTEDHTEYSETDQELVFIGEILSSVDSSKEPTEELQANDAIVGARIYQHGKDIVVFYNDQCWIYRPYHDTGD